MFPAWNNPHQNSSDTGHDRKYNDLGENAAIQHIHFQYLLHLSS